MAETSAAHLISSVSAVVAEDKKTTDAEGCEDNQLSPSDPRHVCFLILSYINNNWSFIFDFSSFDSVPSNFVGSSVSMATRDWTNLPTDPLLLILGRLPVIDYVRFGAVHVSWNRMATSNLVSPAPQIPWLMFCNSDSKNFIGVMFEPFTRKKQCRIRLPKHDRFLGATSDGYMLFHCESEIIMFNPLTRSHIPLPSLNTLPDPDKSWFAITTIAARLKPNVIVAICYRCFLEQSAAFCKTGDKTWTYLSVQSPEIDHIMFYKDQIFGVISYTGVLCSLDLKKNSRRSVRTHEDGIHMNHKYLIQSSCGDLFKVQCINNGTVFEVYKLDKSSKKWHEVKSLGDNAIMFPDWSEESYPLCVSTKDFPQLRASCIYSISHHPRQLRMHNIGDGSTKVLDLPSCKGIGHWVTPTLAK